MQMMWAVFAVNIRFLFGSSKQFPLSRDSRSFNCSLPFYSVTPHSVAIPKSGKSEKSCFQFFWDLQFATYRYLSRVPCRSFSELFFSGYFYRFFGTVHFSQRPWNQQVFGGQNPSALDKTGKLRQLWKIIIQFRIFRQFMMSALQWHATPCMSHAFAHQLVVSSLKRLSTEKAVTTPFLVAVQRHVFFEALPIHDCQSMFDWEQYGNGSQCRMVTCFTSAATQALEQCSVLSSSSTHECVNWYCAVDLGRPSHL